MAYFKCPKTSSGGGGDTAIYGAEWAGTSDPSWTRTDDAVGFADPNPYYSGMSGNPSSPFDTISPWKDLKIVEDSEAGTLVEIPKFYYKWTRDGAKMKLQISMTQHTGFICSPAHMDRGDGSGERDKVYVGRYHCASRKGVFKSTTGVLPHASITRDAFRTGISNLGAKVWQWDYAMYWTICMLYLVEFAHWDSQAKIGYGCGNNSATENMGSTDNMGYHTGTNASSRMTYGHCQYRYIEGLWDNVMDWCDGIYFSSANVYCIKNPASFSDTSGGTQVGTRAATSGNITAWTSPLSATGFGYALYAKTVSGADYTTHVCDRANYGTSGVVLRVGGSSSQSANYGLFSLYGNSAANYSNATAGSRLMKLP